MSSENYQNLDAFVENISITYDFNNEDKVVFLNTSDIYDGKVINHNLTNVSALPGQAKKSIKKGDILFSEIRPANRRFAMVDFDTKNYVISTKIMVIRPKNGILKNYLYLCLTNNKTLKYLQFLAESRSGTFPQITIEQIQRMKVYIPSIDEQKRIIQCAMPIISKIELNNRVNKILEEIAQTIFKCWFIDFEFPNENGETYKSSGGEMVDSEMGLIPKGWKIEKIENLLSEIVTGNRPKGGVSKYKKGIPSIGAESINGLCNYDFSKTKYIPESYFHNMKKGIVKNGDIFLYKDGAKLGRKSMFLEDFPFKRCCVNSHVFILRSNSSMKQSYLFFYLDQEFMTKNIINLNTNSAQPGINSTSVKTLKILLPSDKMLNLFNELVFPILRIIFNNAKENKCLSNLRDALLPKLMSGEIRVPINSKVLISKNN